MVRTWLAIAKAEFQVLSSSLRGHRKIYTGVLYALALVWAVVATPMIYNAVLSALFPMHVLRPMLMVIFPGLMRTVGLFLWLVLLLFPLSYALQEIKIGQWEIFLSNNVRTRDIMTGTFLGKVGLYGLIIIFLAPLLITPFMLAFEVSIIGQLLVYGVVTMLAMGTIWLSNFLTSVIQARLGDSSRGNDIAKALAMVVAIVVIIPMYGLMFFLPTLSEMMGMNAFLILPSTWFADLISWLAITFNGIGMTGSQILGFSSVLQLDMLVTSILSIGFVVGIVGLALITADRVFTIEAGVRTEVVTTVSGENVFLRGVRRINSGPFGSLMVTNIKDFLRKAQNLSKIGYGLVLAIIMPIIMTSMDIEYFQFSELFMMLIVMMSLVGSIPFAGTGFLESKDQLWIIQGAPSGASRFVKSRIVSQALIGIPLAIIPSIIIYFIIEMTLIELALLLGLGYMAVIGGMLMATGVTARNPNYEDTKSPAHQANVMTSVMLAEFSILGVMFVDIFLTIGTGIDFFEIMENIFGPGNMMIGVSVIGLIVQWAIAGILVWSGIRYLSRPEP
ncbi:MAG: hypothetical protein AM326_04305 [Candidatus Thorarchaeota archaeon SMTZ-45]|nr:MAG: hypothetical protein AM326_04305 [Candidatus Thorarchaeota archaeon SMTZ-45]KXH74521.1 MAG: hypothetical protein AM325_05965 [Candidatus Thorarchaeota archaeon SMTZ1-45]